MSRKSEWVFGEQQAWVDAEVPDILWARFRGAITMETSQWSCGVYRQMSESGRFYLAADITGSHLSPESRRFLVENAKPDWFRGIVYIGAGLDQKATTKSLMVRSMLSGGEPLDVQYVDSVEDARVWIEQHRASKFQQRG